MALLHRWVEGGVERDSSVGWACGGRQPLHCPIGWHLLRQLRRLGRARGYACLLLRLLCLWRLHDPLSRDGWRLERRCLHSSPCSRCRWAGLWLRLCRARLSCCASRARSGGERLVDHSQALVPSRAVVPPGGWPHSHLPSLGGSSRSQHRRARLMQRPTCRRALPLLR